jgi:ubiquinone/menaquinone biosynthesis C-methylase UbiE
MDATSLDEVWAAYAEAYDHFYAESLHAAHRTVARRLRPGSVLDLGCGTGKLIHHLPAADEYVGVDSSPQMLDRSRSGVRRPNVCFVQGDIRTTRLGRTFNSVVTVNTLFGLGNVAQVGMAMANIKRHLGPGGVAVIVSLSDEFNPSSLEARILTECRSQVVEPKDERLFRIFLECNRKLAAAAAVRGYRPLTMSYEKARKIADRVGLRAVDDAERSALGGLCFLFTVAHAP